MHIILFTRLVQLQQHQPLATPLCCLQWSSPDLHKLSAGSCMTSRGRLGEGVHVDYMHMSGDTDWRAVWTVSGAWSLVLKPTELCSVLILSLAQATTHWCIVTTWNQWVHCLIIIQPLSDDAVALLTWFCLFIDFHVHHWVSTFFCFPVAGICVSNKWDTRICLIKNWISEM